MAIERRSAPIRILSRALSKCSMRTSLAFSRAANNAASLTRLARSAPEKPGVPRAMVIGSTSAIERHLAHVHSQDLLAALHVRQVDHHLAVEAARAQQRRIEHVGTVGGGDHDHAFAAFEAIHLDQQLVQGLLALVMTAAEAGAAMAADRIDFVDEDDARRVLLGLVEHVAHAAGADADEHLDEIGTGNGEERHFRFAGDGARQQRLAGAGRADHQHAARNAAAQFLEFARIAQELDQLADFFLGFIATGDVGEGDLHFVLALQLGARAAEGHGAAAAALLHLADEVDEDADEQHVRKEGGHDRPQRRRVVRLGLDDLDLVLDQLR